jgi:inorganic pyrophosphatase
MKLTPGPRPPDEIHVLIRATVGSRSLYKLEAGTPVLVEIGERAYPAAYGDIPGTHHIDAEPLDAFVLVTEPPVIGSLLPARPVGLARLEADGKIDDKIIAVCLVDREFDDIKDIAAIPKHQLKELEQAMRADWVRKIRFFDVGRAKRAIAHAISLYEAEFG